MSSEYRSGRLKSSLLIAVPPRKAILPVKVGELKISHSARQMIRSCSTCRISGHGAFERKAWI